MVEGASYLSFLVPICVPVEDERQMKRTSLEPTTRRCAPMLLPYPILR
jgi:hypothetical protein